MIHFILCLMIYGLILPDFSIITEPNTETYDERLDDAIEDFYQSSWDEAGKSFDELRSDYPDDPTPLFFQSMMPFWEYFLIDQTPELANEFLSTSEKAVKLSEQKLEKSPGDTTMVLLLSGLHGYRSLVAAGESNYRVAIKSGMTGFSFTRKLLSLDADRPDARIGRGMFYYMVGTIPREMKWASNMIGLRGDMEQGFEELKIASESDSYISNDAKLMLMYLYEREEEYEEALKYAEMLTQEFPDNVIFKYKQGEILEKIGLLEPAKQTFEEIIELNNPVLTRITEKSRKKVNKLEKFL